MKRTALYVLLLAVVILLPPPGGDASAADKRVLKGEYVWNQGGDGDLEAVFTGTGEDRWDVAFHFEFRGRSHTYKGTAKGSLQDGALEGRVRNENKRRTWTFEGEFENGRFRGKHAEIYGNREQRTGTLTLSGPRSGDEI
ncbi:MAG: hypothetical protein GY719_04700 [bacterium]|nr:hypothetical protein [bacterium]